MSVMETNAEQKLKAVANFVSRHDGAKDVSERLIAIKCGREAIALLALMAETDVMKSSGWALMVTQLVQRAQDLQP